MKQGIYFLSNQFRTPEFPQPILRGHYDIFLLPNAKYVLNYDKYYAKVFNFVKPNVLIWRLKR